MIKVIRYEYEEDGRVVRCFMGNNAKGIFMGEARCHDEDLDMMSTRTGEEIATRRAHISLLCHLRDNDAKPRLAALKHLQGCMRHSSKFNPNSYENSMLCKQIRLLEFDLATLQEQLAYEREKLKEYIQKKDEMYKNIRNQRAGQK